ncbi:MAG: hypothetical protein ACREEM_35865 [Blastocatellia bacterium]
MKNMMLCLLACCLFSATSYGQSKKQELTVDEVKAFVDEAFKNKQRLVITLKNPNVTRVTGDCRDFPKKISVKVTGFTDNSFQVEDRRAGLNETLFGEISDCVEYSNVAAIKKQNRFSFGLRKTGEITATTGIVTLVVAAIPVFLGGMVVCAASGGEHARWACPR